MALKIYLRGLFSGCFTSKSHQRESKRQLSNTSLTQRLSLSDIISDQGSSHFSMDDLANCLMGPKLHVFKLEELESCARGFSYRNYLGGGGFGPVYKGYIDENIRPGLDAQPVAIKLLDLNGPQGQTEWLAEVVFLGQLRHSNIVNLIGYCYEDQQRVLVYEYMATGNLENQLFGRYSISLPWLTRMQIALGAARGLAFLHGEDKPVIYRDFKTSNILLDSDYNAKLSDFGLARDGPKGDETCVTTCVMGTHGYAAPEYVKTGQLTTKSDVYSYGVVLLELLTGRRVLDENRVCREKNLVKWARPLLKDPQKLDRFMDPNLGGEYSTEGAIKAAALAHKCLNYQAKYRPKMESVVKILESILNMKDIPFCSFVYIVTTEGESVDATLKTGR